MEKKVSIIVPMYNASNTIKRCIDSCVNQTYKNLEIIVIDDGSSDNSFDVIVNMQKRDSRINVCRLKNSGVSHARNVGISKSTGYWLMFLDADDYLDFQMIEKILNYNKECEFDTCCWNGIYVNDDKFNKMSEIYPSPKLYMNNGNEFADAMFCNSPKNKYFGDMFRAVWGKLYKRSIVLNNNIYFEEEIKSGEDALWLLDYFFYSKKVLIVNDYLNFYQISNNSFMGKYKNNYLDLEEKQLKSMIRKYDKYNYPSEEVTIKFTDSIIYAAIANNFKYSSSFFWVLNETASSLKESIFDKYAKESIPSQNIFKKILVNIYKIGFVHLSVALYILNYMRHHTNKKG